MKVVLIANQGTGTNMLRAFLNSHPDIFFGKELFVLRDDRSGEYQNWYDICSDQPGDFSETAFLDYYFVSHTEKVVGFDVKYNQMTRKIEQYIKDNEIKVIHLLRDRARSFMRQVKKENEKTFTYKEVFQYCNRIKTNENLTKQKFGGWEDRYLELRYEEITGGKEITTLPKDTEDKILNFLDVDKKILILDNSQIDRGKWDDTKLKIRF